jgi:Domain of unknown function (DUF427)
MPKKGLRHDLLEPSDRRTQCLDKGEASYRSLRAGDRFEPDAVWTYQEPTEAAAPVRHAAFYRKNLDEWLVENEQVLGHPRDPLPPHRHVPHVTRVRVSVDGGTVPSPTATAAESAA